MPTPSEKKPVTFEQLTPDDKRALGALFAFMDKLYLKGKICQRRPA